MFFEIWASIILLSCCHNVATMFIPEDTEILDGYNIDAPVDLLLPEDPYFELRSLNDQRLLRPIRDKRNSKYFILESQGLRSHFKRNSPIVITEPENVPIEYTTIPKSNEYMQNIAYDKLRPPQKGTSYNAEFGNRRTIRSTDQNDSNTETIPARNLSAETLPVPEKQTMMDSYMPEARVTTEDRWEKAPFDYSKVQPSSEDIDSYAAASLNEGIKARTPRVNFVTQQKKSNDLSESVDQNPSAAKPEIYRNIPDGGGDSRYYARDLRDLPSARYETPDSYLRHYDNR